MEPNLYSPVVYSPEGDNWKSLEKDFWFFMTSSKSQDQSLIPVEDLSMYIICLGSIYNNKNENGFFFMYEWERSWHAEFKSVALSFLKTFSIKFRVKTVLSVVRREEYVSPTKRKEQAIYSYFIENEGL